MRQGHDGEVSKGADLTGLKWFPSPNSIGVFMNDQATGPGGQEAPRQARSGGRSSRLERFAEAIFERVGRLSDAQMNLAVILFGLVVYVPFAGSYGLYDPWETHYGEVARQMAVRRDFISLWWPGAPLDADHFWSKPVLSFWLMSLSMLVFGVGNGPSGEIALGARAEWAVRLPFCLMGVLGLWAVYLALSRFVGRRAGVLGVVVLATSPLYCLVARQAMTDMAFVGPMAMALALGALALFDSGGGGSERGGVSGGGDARGRAEGAGADRELPRRRWKRWPALSWPHDPVFYASVALFVVVALPQLVWNSIFLRWTPAVAGRTFVIPGITVMFPYIVGFVAFLWLSARVRYRAPLYLFIAAMLCGVATLAKGIAGLGLPVIIFVAYLLFTWNWKRLGQAQLRYGVLVALLAAAVVAIPWHHAMLVRHGFPFWDELYGDNHWRRLVMGRHGDRGTFEYFLRELGYAVLPWVALVPAALAAMAMRRVRDARRQGIVWFGVIWFVAGYTLVSMSMTKFHHYILPALPGLAMVVACFLDDILARRAARTAAVAALVGLPLLGLVTFDLVSAQNGAQRFIWLFSYDYVNAPKGRPWPEALDFRPALIGFAAALAVPTLLLAWRRFQRLAAVALGLVAVSFGYYLLDGYIPATAAYWSQKPLIASYYRLRQSPDEKLLVWQMYWRGENFYTENEIYEGPKSERTVFLGDKNVESLKEWVSRHRGRRAFFLVERSRWDQVPGMLPEETRASLKKVDESNMKFVLGQVQL
jgi:4-amino-4-deoxy-L-arabinose transferase-like glycosyltransferase